MVMYSQAQRLNSEESLGHAQTSTFQIWVLSLRLHLPPSKVQGVWLEFHKESCMLTLCTTSGTHSGTLHFSTEVEEPYRLSHRYPGRAYYKVT